MLRCELSKLLGPAERNHKNFQKIFARQLIASIELLRRAFTPPVRSVEGRLLLSQSKRVCGRFSGPRPFSIFKGAAQP
jgi:hypothetical protein